MARTTLAKFRYNAAIPIAGIIVLFGAMPLATSRWYLTPVLLVPLAVILWSWLAGVDVRPQRLVVRYPVGRRPLPLTGIQGFTVTRRGVSAVRADGSSVWLPAVRPGQLGLLTEVCGYRVPPAAEAGESGEPATPAGSQGTRDQAG